MADEEIQKITDVVCPFCGCLCDDIEIDVENNKVITSYNACTIGSKKFFSVNETDHRFAKPMLRKNGELVPISWDEAIERAAKILIEAERPLLYGFSSTSNEAIGEGFKLAEEVGGVLDQTASVCHGPSVIAIQDTGRSAATLGEIKSRANVIVFWGSNPSAAHPRHMSRYSMFVRGFFRDKGAKERTLIVVDPRNTDAAKLADIHVRVEQGKDFELVSAMRAALKGVEIPNVVAGIPKEKILELLEIFKTAYFGVLFFGMGLTQTFGRHRNIDNAINLVRDLNSYTKWIISPMRGHYNVTGAGTVWTWQTGYPFAIDFARGHPRYNPGEFCANDVLVNGEADAALIIASDPGAHFPAVSVAHLAKIPTIAIEPHVTPTTELAELILPPSIVGVEEEGTAYRMDHVPIKLRKVVDAPGDCLSDVEILERILKKAQKLNK
ncbi:MAG: formylmethanofuran dehydrogenase subunit B [Candidatus Helarchaeota archaeon]|nr:formylmethanofuran dehydrogenase subunit B [Candidatus Helarchaeota archaeon]